MINNDQSDYTINYARESANENLEICSSALDEAKSFINSNSDDFVIGELHQKFVDLIESLHCLEIDIIENKYKSANK